MEPIEPGRMLDERYRVIARRAAGATATVWETHDEFLRRNVAVKILHDHLAADRDFLARFVDEARTAATVNHPNLVAVYDSITDPPGIVLEWVDGPDLRQRLDGGRLDPAEVVQIGTAVCAGLDALHRQGLVHRDVKPANILLGADANPKLTDFGIATANAGDRTATGVVLGTAKYLAPEQVRGDEIDGRSDVFALAAVLYEALVGRPPWEREGDLPTALARLEEDPADLHTTDPTLPADLCAAVMRGLSREPADRWPDAPTFATALRGGSTLAPPPPAPGTATVALPPTPPAESVATDHTTATTRAPRPVRPRRRRWPRVVGVGIVLAIALLGWTLVTSPGGDDPDRSTTGGSITPEIASIAAFDPEGTGTPGEHNDRAVNAIDGDTATFWPTERYEARDLGRKSGVGLVVTLAATSDVDTITIRTAGGDSWSAAIHVADGITADEAEGIADFGAPVTRAEGLGAIAELSIDGRGDTVVVWITDLGRGPTPIRLAISELTIR